MAAGSTSGIRAGRAYVELGANDKLTATLDRAKKKLQDFGDAVREAGAGVRDAGLRIAAFGAAIAGAAAASVMAYTKIAGDFSDLAAQTGLSVEMMSELETALKDAGTSVEDFAKSAVKMQKAIFEAASGSEAAQASFAALGLDVGRLLSMSPDQQFTAIAEALSKVENPTERLGLAMEIFGKSASKLMPVLAGGASGIQAFRAEAQRLGLSISGETADAADQLGTQIEILKDQTLRVAVAIGEALAPAAREVVAALQGGIGAVVQWIKANRESVVAAVGWGIAIGVVGAAIAAVGVGIIATGAIITGLGTIIGALSAVLGFLSAAWASVHAFTPVTMMPPTEANACVHPSTFSRAPLSGNNSASHVMAATNSMQTPTKVAHRKNRNHGSDVLNAASTGEREYRKMLPARTVLRPRRSVSHPPRRPKTPPQRAVIQRRLPTHWVTSGLLGGTWRISAMAGPATNGSMRSS